MKDWRDVAAGYDAGADGYDARHGGPTDRARARLIERPMLDAVRGARRVLELGAGTGRLLAQVGAPVRVGIDVAGAMLVHAARRGLAVARADAQRLPFADAAFDAVLAGGGVLRYLDADLALAEAARVLAPGGRLAVHQFGARTWSPRTGARRPDSRVHELARVEELLAPARAAGFRIGRIVRWRTLPVPPYAIRIPRWLDLTPVQLWGHVVVVLHRP
jgi:ubiquinone/menaquinone biosynthesis C-methylase UbiE